MEGAYILWSDEVRLIDDVSDDTQRDAFNNCVEIAHISDIKPVNEGSAQNKFEFTVNEDTKSKRYIWKCSTVKEREFWVEGLKKHKAFQSKVVC